MKTLSAAVLALALILLPSCASETPAPAAQQKAPDEQAAIETLKKINQAQTDFIRRTRRYAQNYAELVADHLLDAEPSKTETGYSFLLLPSPDAVSYTLTATPSSGAVRHFFTDNSYTIRAETSKPATAESPQIEK